MPEHHAGIVCAVRVGVYDLFLYDLAESMNIQGKHF